MSDFKNDKLADIEETTIDEHSERLRKWREARLQALQKIEDLVSAAHGKNKIEKHVPATTASGKPHHSHLRECLKELADLYHRPHVSEEDQEKKA
jgi:hypothetical protein